MATILPERNVCVPHSCESRPHLLLVTLAAGAASKINEEFWIWLRGSVAFSPSDSLWLRLLPRRLSLLAQIAVSCPPSSPQNALAVYGSTRSFRANPPRWSPLPNNVRNLRPPKSANSSATDHFLLVSTMEQLPLTMLADFALIWGEPFAAVDAGCPMSPDFVPGPHRQLVFAAFSRDTAILVFISRDAVCRVRGGICIFRLSERRRC
jgi:hypothetical protein